MFLGLTFFIVTEKISTFCRTLVAMATEGKKLNKFSKNKPFGLELRYLVSNIVWRTFTTIFQIMALGSKLAPPQGGHGFSLFVHSKNFKNLLLLNPLANVDLTS
jgi:hypothetical protein